MYSKIVKIHFHVVPLWSILVCKILEVFWRCFVIKGVLRNIAKFIGNTCARVSFLISLLKKRLWHSCFPVNLAKFLRTPFLQNTSGRLLLKYLNFEQKLPIYTAHHTFLESRYLEVTKNRYYILSLEGSQKWYQLKDYMGESWRNSCEWVYSRRWFWLKDAAHNQNGLL